MLVYLQWKKKKSWKNDSRYWILDCKERYFTENLNINKKCPKFQTLTKDSGGVSIQYPVHQH
jgi:hypothetical protein